MSIGVGVRRKIRTFSWLFVALGLLLGLVLGMGGWLRPYFTHQLSELLQKIASEQFPEEVKIGKIAFRYPDELDLEEVLIKKEGQDTLLYLRQVSLDLGLRKLLLYNQLRIDQMQLKGGLLVFNKGIIKNNKHLDSVPAKAESFTRFELGLLQFSDLELRVDTSSLLESPLRLLLNGQLSSLREERGSFSFNLDDLSGEDLSNGTRLKYASAQIEGDLHLGQWHAKELVLRTSKSYFHVPVASLGYLKEEVPFGQEMPFGQKMPFSFTVQVDSANIALWEWAPYVGKFPFSDQRLVLKLEAMGYRDDFCGVLREFSLAQIAQCRGIFSYQEIGEKIQYNLELEDSFLEAEAVSMYLPQGAETWLSALGRIKYQARLYGSSSRARLDAQIVSDIGDMRLGTTLEATDLRRGLIHYRGQLHTDTLSNLEGLLPVDVSAVQLLADFEGERMDRLDLRASLPYLKIHGCELRAIRLDVSYLDPLFEIETWVEDPSLRLKGRVVLDRLASKLSGELDLKHLDLYALGVLDRPLQLRTHLALDLEGDSWKNAIGSLRFTNIYLKNGLSSFHEPLLDLRVEHSELEGYTLLIDAQLVELHMRAKDSPWLTLSQGYAHLLGFFSIQKKEVSGSLTYHATGSCRLDILSRYLSLRLPEVPRFSEEASFSFDLEADSSMYRASMQLRADTIRLLRAQVYGTRASLSYHKKDSMPLTGSFRYTAQQHELGDFFSLRDPFIDVEWEGTRARFQAGVEPDTTESYARLRGDACYEQGLWECSFSGAQFKLLGHPWSFTENSSLVWSFESGIEALYLSLYSRHESLTLRGEWLSERGELALLFDHFDLSNLAPILRYKPSGVLEGSVFLFKKDRHQLSWHTDLRSKDFALNDVAIGDTRLGLTYSDARPHLIDVKTEVKQATGRAELGGYLYLRKKSHQLSLGVEQMPAQVLGLFLGPTFTEIKGQLSGSMSFNGKWYEPQIHGQLSIKEGYMQLDYLKTPMHTQGDVLFLGHEIDLSALSFRDNESGSLGIRGRLRHKGLEPVSLDLWLDLSEYQLMDMYVSDHEYYYGEAYVSGSARLRGTTRYFSLEGDLRTESATRIYLPMYDEEVNEASMPFIQMTDGRSMAFSGLIDPVLSESSYRMEMSLNLDVQPGTYCEMITQASPPEYLRFLSEGNVRLQIDKRSTFSLFGNLSLTQGTYRLGLYGLLSKDFGIETGSTLKWNGSPWDVEVGMRMRYAQFVSTAPLEAYGETQLQNVSNVQANAIIGIDGRLLSPDLSFDVEIPEFQNNSPFLQHLRSDEQARKQQVLSLIFLRRFAPREGIAQAIQVDNTDFLAGTGEVISGQINTLLADIDADLSVNMDLSNQQLGLSYAFLQGRLHVQRNATLLPSATDTNQQIFEWVGHWGAEYIFSKSGKWRLKLHLGALPHVTQGITLSQSPYVGQFTTGVSLRYLSRFDRLFSGRPEVK